MLTFVHLRVSATEWLEEVLPDEPSWRLEDTVRLAGVLAEHGVDLIDISSSGMSPAQKIKSGPAYQVPFSEAVKKATGDKILVSAVGNITDGKMAQGILNKVSILTVRVSSGYTEAFLLIRLSRILSLSDGCSKRILDSSGSSRRTWVWRFIIRARSLGPSTDVERLRPVANDGSWVSIL